MLIVGLRPYAFAGLSVLMCAVALGEPPAKPEEAKAKADVAAYIGSDAITLQELDAKALKSNMKLAQSLYDARKAVLDQVIMERLLGPDAKSQGITVDQLLSKRLAEKAQPVTAADIEAYFNANSAKMGGKTQEQMSDQIKSFLSSQREKDAKDGLLAQLREKASVKITLEVPRIDVPIAANDPIKGGKDAKVTIVEFSDFQ